MRHLHVVRPEPVVSQQGGDASAPGIRQVGVGALLALVRPSHWVKNFLILIPPFFAGRLFSLDALVLIAPAVGAFCCAASAGYVINDIADASKDRLHPRKRFRPIAAGRITVGTAGFLGVSLLVVSFVVALAVTPQFAVGLAAYVLTSASYTLFLKNIFLLDIFAIAACYVIRVLAGGAAFGVPVSNWLFLTLFFVALFLAVGKRLGERRVLGGTASLHRKSLGVSSEEVLRAVLWAMAVVTLVMYALYTVEVRNSLYYTVPIATYGILRYLMLIEERKTGDPTELVLQDRQLVGLLCLWTAVVGVLIYA